MTHVVRGSLCPKWHSSSSLGREGKKSPALFRWYVDAYYGRQPIKPSWRLNLCETRHLPATGRRNQLIASDTSDERLKVEGQAKWRKSLSPALFLYLSCIEFKYISAYSAILFSSSLSALAKRDQRNSSRKYKHLSWINTAPGFAQLRPIVRIVRLSTQFDLLICI